LTEKQSDVRIARGLMWLTWIAGGGGLAVASGASSSEDGLVVVAWTVGLVGVVSFFRHSVFHRADAARMGWEGGNPGFQIEVGFANLAMGLVAIASAVWAWGPTAQGAVVLAYGLYILQSALIHTANAIHGGDHRRHDVVVAALGYALSIAFAVFAVIGMGAAGVSPF